MRSTWRICLGLLVKFIEGISGFIGKFFGFLDLTFSIFLKISLWFSHYLMQRCLGHTAWAPKGRSQAGPNCPRLPVLHNVKTTLATNKIWSLSSEHAHQTATPLLLWVSKQTKISVSEINVFQLFPDFESGETAWKQDICWSSWNSDQVLLQIHVWGLEEKFTIRWQIFRQ